MDSTSQHPEPGAPGDTRPVAAPPWLPGDELLIDPVPGPMPPPEPRRRRRSRGRVVAIVLLAIAAVLSVAVVVGEWATQTAEADALLDQIERSEAAMVVAMDTVSATLEQEGAYDGGLSDQAAQDLSQAAGAARDEVALAADAMSAIAVQPWHGGIAQAREAYLEHSRAWRDFLARAELEPSSWFVEDPSIETTWNAFTAELPDIVPMPDVRSLGGRVAAILDEGDGGGDQDSGGDTLQAAGPLLRS